MSRRTIRKTRIIPLSRSELPQCNPENPKGQTRTIRIFRKVKSGKFRITRICPVFALPPYPEFPAPHSTRARAGNRLAGPTGRKWAARPFSRSQGAIRQRRRGKAPFRGLNLCPAASAFLPFLLLRGGFPVTPPSTITGVT